MTEQNNISPEAKTSAANTSANNKRIAKNTIALYIRMLVALVVNLYTSRVILDVLGVSVNLLFQYPDGDILSSQANHEQLIDRMNILEKKLEAANKVDEFRKKSLRDLRTELNSAVGYAELCRRHGSQMDLYLNNLGIVVNVCK